MENKEIVYHYREAKTCAPVATQKLSDEKSVITSQIMKKHLKHVSALVDIVGEIKCLMNGSTKGTVKVTVVSRRRFTFSIQ